MEWTEEAVATLKRLWAEGGSARAIGETLGGISRYRDGQWTHWTTTQGLKTDRVFTLAIDQNKTLWFGHGLSRQGGGGLSATPSN